MKMDMAEQQTQLMPQFHGTYSHRPGQVEPCSSVAVGKPCKERYVAGEVGGKVRLGRVYAELLW